MNLSKHRPRATVVALVAALAMVFALPASAHDGGDPFQAPVTSDHLVKVGEFVVPFEGLTSDVWALGNYAYLGSFSTPFCSFDITGTRIIDISDPTNPTQVSFIKDKQGTRTNDVKAFSLDTSKWSGDILVTTNEGCGFSLPRLNSNGGKARAGRGGISIYDVSDPTKPHALKQNFLPKANGIHNTYVWEDDGNAYLIAVDDIDLRDVIIINITNPASPKVITRTGAPDWPDLDFSEIEGPAVFLHDVWVQENDGQTIAYLSYWDAGLVLLDVSDPASPVFLGDSTYPNPDLSGLPPEGNGHVAVPNDDGSLVIFEDEDTNRFSTFLDSTIDGASGTNKVGVSLFGPNPIASFPTAVTTVGGRGCDGDPAIPTAVSTGEVVLIERGVCFFSEKAGNAVDAGYDGYIVYNSVAGGEGIMGMSAGTPEGTEIPGLFVTRSLGLAMKAALDGAKVVTADAVFGVADGEGFMRVFDVTDPENIIEIGTYATERTLPPGNVDSSTLGGTRDAHNVVVDGTTAYWAWYHEGIRVVDFSDCNAGDGFGGCTPVEIGHFGGGATPVYDFWGVYVHTIPADGGTYILGSDRGEAGFGGGGLVILETP